MVNTSQSTRKDEKRVQSRHIAFQDRSIAVTVKNAVKALPDLGLPVSPVTVSQWCSGHRRAPSWFVKVLADRLLAREIELKAIREALATYPVGRGQGVNLIEYNKRKRDQKARQRHQEEQEQARRNILSGS